MSNRAAGPADWVDLRPYRDLVALVIAPLRHRRVIALVRPDGYLAAVGTADDTTGIHDYLQHLAAAPIPTANAFELVNAPHRLAQRSGPPGAGRPHKPPDPAQGRTAHCQATQTVRRQVHHAPEESAGRREES